MFIDRDTIGRKRLYAYSSVQAYFPNGHDIVEGSPKFNYEMWLTFDARYYTAPTYYEPFSKYNFEYRFTNIPTNKCFLNA